MVKKLTGVVAPLLTPLDSQGRIDLDVYENLVRYCYSAGVSNFFMMGTAGEGGGIVEAEKCKAIERIVENWNDRTCLICGVLEPTTARAVLWMKQAESIGIRRFAITPPYYGDMTLTDVFSHYRMLSEAARPDTTLYIYNIPGETGIDVPVSMVKQLKLLGNYRGIKNSSESLNKLIDLIEETKDEQFSVLQGYEDLAIAGLLFGADGIVPCDANIFPEFFTAMMSAARLKDYETLFSMNSTAKKVLTVQTFSPYWISSLKAAAEFNGIGAMDVSAPYVAAKPEEKEKVAAFMRHFSSQIERV